MNSLTGFDDEESFFGSYDAEQAALRARLSLAFDEQDDQPPTPEQLARSARFRRPVALVVAGMALMSMVALGKHSAEQHGFQRELVAHYSSALAAPALAPTPDANATPMPPARAPEASSAFVPEAVSALIAEVVSVLVPEASSAAAPAASASSVDPALAPAATNVAFEISAQPGSRPDSAFVSELTPMCLLPGAPTKFKSVARFPNGRR